MVLMDKFNHAKEMLEYIAYCSECMAPVEVEETDFYIKCKACGHTKDKKKVKNMTGMQVIKKLKKMGKL